MLLEFKVANFGSIAEEQVFSMSPAKGSSNVHQTGSKFQPEVLKVAAVYGANGAGKSTLIKAISWFSSLVEKSGKLNSTDQISGWDPFLLDKQMVSAPTKFEATFILGPTIWRYGL